MKAVTFEFFIKVYYYFEPEDPNKIYLPLILTLILMY
jgi:hypothetical protein